MILLLVRFKFIDVFSVVFPVEVGCCLLVATRGLNKKGIFVLALQKHCLQVVYLVLEIFP